MWHWDRSWIWVCTIGCIFRAKKEYQDGLHEKFMTSLHIPWCHCCPQSWVPMMDDKEGMVAILGVGCSSAVCIGFGCGSSAGGSEPQVYLCGAGFFIYPELTHSLTWSFMLCFRFSRIPSFFMWRNLSSKIFSSDFIMCVEKSGGGQEHYFLYTCIRN